jgi:hypothetical protein
MLEELRVARDVNWRRKGASAPTLSRTTNAGSRSSSLSKLEILHGRKAAMRHASVPLATITTGKRRETVDVLKLRDELFVAASTVGRHSRSN